MKGDFSRNSFKPNKQYSSVRMQQGRVQLDADWNEQMEIIDYYNRLFTEDFLGTAVGPSTGAGFAIKASDSNSDFNIEPGRYYVNGVLLENLKEISYAQQPYYPNATVPPFDQTANSLNNIYLAYLEVWQQSVSAAEDPSIAETALAGADTTIRLRDISQVKLLPVVWDGNLQLMYSILFDVNNSTSTAVQSNVQHWNTLVNRLDSSAISQLMPKIDTSATLQNQLYRIEIHQGSKDNDGNPTTPTFKWSRDNASVSSQITKVDLSDSSNIKITIATAPQDELTSFNLNQWLELTTPARELTDQPGDMVQITDVNGLMLTVKGTVGSDISEENNAIVRRWDTATSSSSSSAINPINTSAAIPIENGLSITFTGGDFKTGDYWLMPARAATNSIEWPKDSNNFLAQMPQGIERFYAPLAILQRTATGWAAKDDSRTIATPANKLNVVGADLNAPTPSIYVDREGQVGIGTQQPSAKLDVEGTMLVSELATLNNGLTVDGAETNIYHHLNVTGGPRNYGNPTITVGDANNNGTIDVNGFINVTARSGSTLHAGTFQNSQGSASTLYTKNSSTDPLALSLEVDGNAKATALTVTGNTTTNILNVTGNGASAAVATTDTTALSLTNSSSIPTLNVINNSTNVGNAAKLANHSSDPTLDVTNYSSGNAAQFVNNTSNPTLNVLNHSTSVGMAAQFVNNTSDPTINIVNNGSGNAVKLANSSSANATLYLKNTNGSGPSLQVDGNAKATALTVTGNTTTNTLNVTGNGASAAVVTTDTTALSLTNSSSASTLSVLNKSTSVGMAAQFVNSTADATLNVVNNSSGNAATLTNNNPANATLYLKNNNSSGPSLQVDGNTTMNGALTIKNRAACSSVETLKIIRGSVNGDLSNSTAGIKSGTGFSVSRIAQGNYVITFTEPFTSRPSAVVTQLFSGDHSGGSPYDNTATDKSHAGDTRDNAVIVGINASTLVLATGGSDGDLEDRDFEFIAIGPS